jgi:hypothetical protein
MRKFDPIVLGIVAFTIIAIVGVLIAFFLTEGKSIKQYSNSDPARPKIEVSQTNFDLGKISVDNTAARDIVIKNLGTGPLVVSNTYTSCDCTSAKWNINGVSSKLFSMSKDKAWQDEIGPNSDAILTVIYEPKIMPVKGTVDRTVTFSTNDPQNPLINIELKAEVE